MKQINRIIGKTIPLDMSDVDTDLIIPAQYLTSVKKQGYGEHLFQRLKDADDNFVFNQAQYQQSNILISRENFGCGSSREHAVWALKEAGIEVVIAESFADIFFNNASKNGLLLIKQPKSVTESLIADTPLDCVVDLPSQTIEVGQKNYNFEVNSFTKYCFMEGMDEVDYLMSHLDKIKQHKEQHKPHYKRISHAGAIHE
jgi:3-isopropylmalate/(R)-2-methylmalate dehydratase small subunit